MSREQDNVLGKTLDIYRRISIALNTFSRNEKVSIEDLAKKADVHWNTARKALLLFATLDRMAPKFQMESKSKFRIVRKPNAISAVEGIFESLEMRILVKLMLGNAIEEKTAQKVDEFLHEEEKQVLQELVSKGFVNSIEGRFYLSKRGQSLASVGIKELVKLGIELPWEKTIRRSHLDEEEKTIRTSLTVLRWTESEECPINIALQKRLYKWEPSKLCHIWQSYRDEKHRMLCYTK